MDDSHFDVLSRALGARYTRRATWLFRSSVLAGPLLGLRGVGAAAKGKKGKARKKHKKVVKRCLPNCDRKICGDDGCGGACGTCEPGFTCIGGRCQCRSPRGLCGGCVDMLSNPQHCGSCDVVCTGNTNVCSHGECCSPPQVVRVCIGSITGRVCDAETSCNNGDCLPTGYCP
jgi:hypothetical protein